ncbi:MAG: recombinase family protein [Flavobacteriales bacterium]|nr:recombinase family protein [Flavobacteriales bacterium]MCW8937604.1 recombinase family protein [Flavobacteriales bacterium]MCW8968795.1 recombinase family protein [Flavobacteriales bacterium]MCW8990092.1 recombinase family protein [Flavobacteriales bacterium]MCW9019810.1 recombinase family protein [Flavobacteriales bacterium]
MKTKNKICLLVRVSSTKQDYQRQLTELQGYCKLRNFEIVHTISSIVTANKSNCDRDDIKELLSEAKKGTFNKVVVTEVSRIGRKPDEIKATLNHLHKLGISVVFKSLAVESLDENLQPTFISNLIIAIYSEIAAEETRMLSARIRSGLEHVKKQGRQLGRPTGSGTSDKELLKKYHGLLRDLDAGISLRKCQAIHNLSRTTICKVKRVYEAD